MSELPDVRPGQVWADNDRRSSHRRLAVIEVTDLGDGPRALVENTVTGDRTRIAVRRFRPTSTGYRLVKDVPR